MKITICSYDGYNFNVGGPWAWLPRFVKLLTENGLDVNFIFFYYGQLSECQNISFFQKQGYKVKLKALASRSQYRNSTEDRVKWILGVVKNDPPDVFMPNLVLPAFYASKWIMNAGIPCVGILHSDDIFFHSLVHEFVNGEPDFQLDAIVCVSKLLKETIESNSGKTKTHISLIWFLFRKGGQNLKII